jgi:hypothetical protein
MMDQATFDRETSLNRAAYDRLRDQIHRDHAGQYVVLTEGKLIAASPTYDEAMAVIQQLRPVPEYFLVFPAEEEPDFEPYDSF